MPPPEGQNSPPKKTRPNFQTNQGPRVIWVSCNIYIYIILYAHFSGYPNFSGGMSWKSPHISRPFFVQAYEAVDQVDFWEELLGERRGKMTCFLIPNLFGEVVEESLRKRYWDLFFDPNFFWWFPNDSFLTHVLKNHCKRMDPRYWWWMQTSGIWGTAVRMANLHGLPPSTGLAYLWKVEKVNGATPNRWRFVRGPW